MEIININGKPKIKFPNYGHEQIIMSEEEIASWLDIKKNHSDFIYKFLDGFGKFILTGLLLQEAYDLITKTQVS